MVIMLGGNVRVVYMLGSIVTFMHLVSEFCRERKGETASTI